MSRKAVTAAVAAALGLAISAPAHAAPPGPTPPDSAPGTVWEGEAATGTWQEAYDDYGAEITVVDRKYLVLDYYSRQADYDANAQVYFNIRGGSEFFLNYCDEEGFGQDIVQVSRKRFLERVADERERSITFTYDADRDSGTFVVRSGYFDENGEGLYTCDPAGSNAEPPRGR